MKKKQSHRKMSLGRNGDDMTEKPDKLHNTINKLLSKKKKKKFFNQHGSTTENKVTINSTLSEGGLKIKNKKNKSTKREVVSLADADCSEPSVDPTQSMEVEWSTNEDSRDVIGIESKVISDENRGQSANKKSKEKKVIKRVKPINWASMDLTDFQKDFFKPSFNLKNRSKYDVEEFRKKNKIEVEGEDIPNPIESFTDYDFPDFIMEQMRLQNFIEPSPIQAQSWPLALSGRNLVAISKTGSGKTLAYMLPAIIHVENQPQVTKGDGPIVLVLAPTRELAQQICDVTKKFGSMVGIRPCCIVGGVPKAEQVKEVRQGCEVVVATPGRLLELLAARRLSLLRCSYLVLDEADRMLDMGFEPQIRQVLSQIRPSRQSLLFSATWPASVAALASELLPSHTRLTVGQQLCVGPNVTQVVEVCSNNMKDGKLLSLLRTVCRSRQQQALVFCHKRKRVDILTAMLKAKGWSAAGIHGEMPQGEREEVLEGFRSGASGVLVATDVAARGLDVAGLRTVISYDSPASLEQYVHRVGRTGRQGNTGAAYTFLAREHPALAGDLVALLRASRQRVDPKLLRLAEGKSSYEEKERKQAKRNKGRRRRFSKEVRQNTEAALESHKNILG